MLVWELVGAVVGAGMASGREIASFFSQYGCWGFVGAVVSAAAMICLVNEEVRFSGRVRWMQNVWEVLVGLLLLVTGGAMLSGSGEIVALILPFHSARLFGVMITLLQAWLLARRIVSGLARLSRVLLSVLLALICLGFTIEPMKAVSLQKTNPLEAVLRGLTYGGFNAALQVPIMAGAAKCSRAARRKAAMTAGGVILCILMLGNAVLLRHPALIGETMPFLMMLNRFGKAGYFLGALSLYLAILSTLTACLRGLKGTALPIVGILLVSALGFTGVVEVIYPILGGGCFFMLADAKFMNCLSNPFHSRKDMI